MSDEQCIIPECERKARSRGLCTACYISARLRITAGETTWEQLGELGLAHKRRYPAGPFIKAFRAAMKQTGDA